MAKKVNIVYDSVRTLVYPTYLFYLHYLVPCMLNKMFTFLIKTHTTCIICLLKMLLILLFIW